MKRGVPMLNMLAFDYGASSGRAIAGIYGYDKPKAALGYSKAFL